MMMTSNTRTCFLAILVSAALLAGCSGSQSPLAPSNGVDAVRSSLTPPYLGLPSALLRRGAPPAGARKKAVVTPDNERHETLAYIGNFESGEIEEFRFPKGELLNNPIPISGGGGMCSRTYRGDFWVVDSGSETVNEYKAGGSQVLKTLAVTAGDPAGCAISKSNDDLAVSLVTGGIVIFKHASGSGTPVSDGLLETYFIGYDGSGDLFADGFTSSDKFGFVEMPAGSSTFHSVSLPNTVEFPGNVQWDGTYMTVEDQEANAIYRYSVSGSTATLEGTVELSDASDCVGGDIFKGKYFLCPDAGDDDVKVYAYPAGGAPIDTWTGFFDEPIGSIVIEK
jgi:hypothetical protein